MQAKGIQSVLPYDTALPRRKDVRGRQPLKAVPNPTHMRVGTEAGRGGEGGGSCDTLAAECETDRTTAAASGT